MNFFQLIFSLFFLLILTSVICIDKPCTKKNCQLPSCQCAIINKNPTSFNNTDIPQLVLLTFVGNLNKHTFEPVRSILHPIFRNPNQCPISSTFFVNDNFTDYCLVQRLFDNHNEIAMTTSSNKCPLMNCYDENNWNRWGENNWKREIRQQRINLIEKSSIHRSHIKGFRVPHLQIDDNRHFEPIRNLHFHYDSSMLFKSSKYIWPFTLDYSFNQIDCINCNESSKTIETLWQFPLHEWAYPNTTTTCRTLSDSTCLPEDELHTADLLYDFIIYNFDRHSSLTLGRRSPFVIELDLFWLSEHRDQRLEALIRFIDYILNNDDYRYVYFVSIEQALEWLKYPRNLTELEDFWAFSCSEIIYEYDIDCADTKPTDGEKPKQLTSTNTTEQYIDLQAERLFRSGIVLYSVWTFILLILTVLFYDKYFVNK
ncbi:unnamed protein product [Rotaria socialis]|uniref:Uncharacterized protein n=2 Tax=Rotaria socialis TaxID=392032 RepID=A0A817XAC5_9BILA|nr:unnamed protein product [Rotaria socialis]CAF3365648.1 unnamed protein product [Rotaria socialis]